MTDQLFELFATYGIPLLTLTTFASCLALPVPSSLLMMASGAFAASGDINLAGAMLAALTGAILGDQLGFHLGTVGQERLAQLIETYPRRAAILARARNLLRKRGATGVFLSRWLFSPLGPYVNFSAGAAGVGWARFTLWAVFGEIIWVSIYSGLGFVFSSSLSAAADVATNISGLLAGGALMALTGRWLLHAMHEHRLKKSKEL
ncbi:VTT domain-containing protein [Rhodobacteraceae bacterium D3-12]|nr:VTT domain-containing protein [Rhodobacteraceae bacterium D3-12]